MRASEVYRRAAELVSDELTSFSCCAISWTVHGDSDYPQSAISCRERSKYFNRFAPQRGMHRCLEWDWDKDERILALLLMSAIAAEEEKEKG